SPTFKWLTRNPEKLLRVLESLLAWDAGLLTCNYCIHARYLARRARLVRPPHHEREIDPLLRNLDGLAPRHRTMILTLQAESKGLVRRAGGGRLVPVFPTSGGRR